MPDPAATVPVDIDKLASAATVSPRIRFSGFAYDVATGLLKQVVAPRTRGDVGA